jgi:hypothetical protein
LASEETVGGTRERELMRPAKAVLAAVLLGGLLAVVALAARSRHPGGGGVHLHQRTVPASVANDLLTVVVIGYVIAVILLAVLFYWLRDDWKAPSGRSWLRQLLILAVALASVAFLGYRIQYFRNLNGGHGGNAGVTTVGAVTHPRTLPNLPAARKPAEFDWIFASVVGVGLVVLAIVLLRRRRVAAPVETEDETIEEELTIVVSDAIDDLRREPDARRAVIAAYARMEGALGRHGEPRHPSEAPFEYLARILLRLRVRPGAVRDLTELFERAKFSTHEIDQPMKERAIAALVSVRDDLQAVPA